jgi:hypothetical protein
MTQFPGISQTAQKMTEKKKKKINFFFSTLIIIYIITQKCLDRAKTPAWHSR